MPSFLVTPAQLTITGGEALFVPPRFTATAASLTITGGTVNFGNLSGGDLSVTTPELDRLRRADRLLDPDGGPSVRFQAIWQETMEAIEDAFAALTTQVNDNTSLLAAIQNAQNLASAANDNATEAVNTVNIANSYTDPVTVLSASNTGAVTIIAHTRNYGDGGSVSVDSGSVSGFANGAYVTVYYDDAARAGGAVSYQGTISAVAQTGNRHVVGSVTIPAVGAVSNTGRGASAPGYILPDIPPGTLSYI